MGIGDRLTLGRLADKDFVVITERDNGRGRAVPLAVFQNLGLAAIHHSDTGVRGA